MCGQSKFFASVSAGLIAVIIAGCASNGVYQPNGVVNTQRNEKAFVQETGIEPKEIVAVADKMARGIMSVPEIAKAAKVSRVVLLPMKNETQFPFNKDIFLAEVMMRLNERAGGKVRFHSGAADGNGQQLQGADYLLSGKLVGESTTTSAGTTDYLLYSFELINPNTSEIIWNGSHRLKKHRQQNN